MEPEELRIGQLNRIRLSPLDSCTSPFDFSQHSIRVFLKIDSCRIALRSTDRQFGRAFGQDRNARFAALKPICPPPPSPVRCGNGSIFHSECSRAACSNCCVNLNDLLQAVPADRLPSALLAFSMITLDVGASGAGPGVILYGIQQ